MTDDARVLPLAAQTVSWNAHEQTNKDVPVSPSGFRYSQEQRKCSDRYNTWLAPQVAGGWHNPLPTCRDLQLLEGPYTQLVLCLPPARDVIGAAACTEKFSPKIWANVICITPWPVTGC